VVEVLEKEGKGLNLTREVREGILKHSKSREGILGENWENPSTLEGQICKIADTIAYINHDIGDALRAGLIAASDLPESSIAVLGDSHSARINTLVSDVVEHSWAATGLKEGEERTPMISLSPAVLAAMNTLRDFLFERVYEVRAMKQESERAREVLRSLYYYFIQNPHELPEEFTSPGPAPDWVPGPAPDRVPGPAPDRVPGQGVERGVVDYIAGMTDHFALNKSAGIAR
jgi:dGTPase